MFNESFARQVVKGVGGMSNVKRFGHCATRLRFNLVDSSKANQEALRHIKGVMGVKDAGQLQIIIGNDVLEAYEAIEGVYHFGSKSGGADAAVDPNQSIGKKFLQYLVGIFQPLIPVLAGAGVLKSLLLLANLVGLIASDNQVYVAMAAISDAVFYYLPIFVAVSTADMFKCQRVTAAAAVAYLLLPATRDALANGMQFVGLTVQIIPYNAQVFPAILSVIFLSFVERWITKVSPKPIRTFFVPMVSLAVTVPVTLLVLGPLGYNFGQLLTAFILFMYNTFGWIAVAFLAGVLPFMIAMGMHKALVPYALSSLAQVGYETLYLTASLAHNISESGACFGVAVRTKNSELKQTAISAGVSALMGITEPALYGVTLMHKRAMRGVVISGVVTGAAIGLFGIKAFVSAAAGLPSLSMYVDADNAMNFVYAIICFFMALVLSFAIVAVTWKDEAEAGKALVAGDESGDAGSAAEQGAGMTDDAAPTVDEFLVPVSGECVPLSAVPDEVFAAGTLGDGVAIRPSAGVLCAPAEATVAMLFETSHAIGLKLDDGCEVLMHVGVDTVQMQGAGFMASVKTGERVRAGQALIHFDVNAIEAAGHDPIVSIIVSSNDFRLDERAAGAVAVGDPLFRATRE